MDNESNEPEDYRGQAKTIPDPFFKIDSEQFATETRMSVEDLSEAKKELNSYNIENLSLTSFDEKFHLLCESVERVLSDGVINQHEVEFLRLFALKLGFHYEIVQFITDCRGVSREQLKATILKKKLY